MLAGCVFCNLGDREVLWGVGDGMAFLDAYPVTVGHSLVIVRRHVSSYYELVASEQQLIWRGVQEVQRRLNKRYSPDGFNVGFNEGVAAGQTVMHFHVHVIPRYNGDVPDPSGGIRGVIPGKQKYIREVSFLCPVCKSTGIYPENAWMACGKCGAVTMEPQNHS